MVERLGHRPQRRTTMIILAVWISGASTVATLETPIPDPIGVRYRARLAYHGASFAGFQLQTRKDQRSVQGVLENSLQRSFGIVTGERIIKVHGASRTDAGVHARGQVVHFDAPATTPSLLQDVQRSLDYCLPDDVVVWDLQVAPTASAATVLKNNGASFRWSVLFHSKAKRYVYRISLAQVADPLDNHQRWHVPYNRDVDVDVLNTTLKLFVGTHDFRAFAASDFEGSTSVKTVYSVDLVPENDDNANYRIEVLLKGALYKQVRNMVGSALEEARRPGKRRRNVNVARLLSTGAPRHDNPAKPAPPHGLTLEHVYFDDF
jgi:tRNA pseudouridine38-40 synthase